MVANVNREPGNAFAWLNATLEEKGRPVPGENGEGEQAGNEVNGDDYNWSARCLDLQGRN